MDVKQYRKHPVERNPLKRLKLVQVTIHSSTITIVLLVDSNGHDVEKTRNTDK